MVLVHYLNVPLSDETPLPPLTIQPHKQQWEESQLLAQLRPMCKYEGVMSVTGTATQTAGGRKPVTGTAQAHV